jgi:hypothetical protein
LSVKLDLTPEQEKEAERIFAEKGLVGLEEYYRQIITDKTPKAEPSNDGFDDIPSVVNEPKRSVKSQVVKSNIDLMMREKKFTKNNNPLSNNQHDTMAPVYELKPEVSILIEDKIRETVKVNKNSNLNFIIMSLIVSVLVFFVGTNYMPNPSLATKVNRADFDTNLSNIAKDIAEVKTAQSSATQKLTANDGVIKALQSQNTQLQQTIASLQSQIDALKAAKW